MRQCLGGAEGQRQIWQVKNESVFAFGLDRREALFIKPTHYGFLL